MFDSTRVSLPSSRLPEALRGATWDNIRPVGPATEQRVLDALAEQRVLAVLPGPRRSPIPARVRRILALLARGESVTATARRLRVYRKDVLAAIRRLAGEYGVSVAELRQRYQAG